MSAHGSAVPLTLLVDYMLQSLNAIIREFLLQPLGLAAGLSFAANLSGSRFGSPCLCKRMAGPVLERRNYKIWGCFQQGLLMWVPRNGLAYICIFAHLKAASPQTRAPLFDPRTSLHSSFQDLRHPPIPTIPTHTTLTMHFAIQTIFYIIAIVPAIAVILSITPHQRMWR